MNIEDLIKKIDYNISELNAKINSLTDHELEQEKVIAEQRLNDIISKVNAQRNARSTYERELKEWLDTKNRISTLYVDPLD